MSKTDILFQWTDTIFADESALFLNPCNPVQHDIVTFRIRVYKENPVKKIFLRSSPEGEEIFDEMHCVRKDAFFSWYETRQEIHSEFFHYRFLILCEDNQVLYYNKTGLHRTTPVDYYDFKFFTGYESSEWLKNAVFYQIFPDRFHNGNPARNYRNGEYVYCGRVVRSKKWGEAPDAFSHGGHLDFYNGDIEGIYQKLDYIQERGFNALYLNPVFTSLSNHKYDVQDYFEIDPHLGDDRVFSALCGELHKRGMHIILDGVFNHTGVSCRWFNKNKLYSETGAYNSKSSPYYDFYTFYEYPEQYEKWLGVDTLPKLNYRSERLRDMIYRSENAVMKYWMKRPFEIDGWRCDVANMQARQKEYQEHITVWQEVRKNLKQLRPDCYLMGEHFFDGSELLNKNCLDGVMNYQGFYFPVYRWMAGEYDCSAVRDIPAMYTGEDALVQMQAFYSALPMQKSLSQYNLINSHDRARFISVTKDIQKTKSATILLMAFPGTPGVFYGDEIGLEGMRDPDCRRCMIWDKKDWNHDIAEFYQRIVHLRKNSESLKQGSILWLEAGKEHMAFARFSENECILACVSISGKSVEIPVHKLGIIKGTGESLICKKSYAIKNAKLTFSGYGDLIQVNV